ICSAFNSAVDIYTTDIVLDHPIEFTTRKIKVIVTLEDASGINLNSSLPPECIGQLSNLVGHITFGSITDFELDPETHNPVAYISSNQSGSGKLEVTWNNNYISRILNRDNNNIPTSVEILS